MDKFNVAIICSILVLFCVVLNLSRIKSIEKKLDNLVVRKSEDQYIITVPYYPSRVLGRDGYGEDKVYNEQKTTN